MIGKSVFAVIRSYLSLCLQNCIIQICVIHASLPAGIVPVPALRLFLCFNILRIEAIPTCGRNRIKQGALCGNWWKMRRGIFFFRKLPIVPRSWSHSSNTALSGNQSASAVLSEAEVFFWFFFGQAKKNEEHIRLPHQSSFRRWWCFVFTNNFFYNAFY